jgi:ribosomal small subunit protein bTHX
MPAPTIYQECASVGKGDRKTRRGKIYNGSFGKSRPKSPDKNKAPVAAAKRTTSAGSTTRK